MQIKISDGTLKVKLVIKVTLGRTDTMQNPVISSVKKTEESNERNNPGLVRQLSCAFVVNLVSLLQGASVSSSSIILHELENNTEHIQAWGYILYSYFFLCFDTIWSFLPSKMFHNYLLFRTTTVTDARTAQPPTTSSWDPSPSLMTSTSHRRREAGLVWGWLLHSKKVLWLYVWYSE